MARQDIHDDKSAAASRAVRLYQPLKTNAARASRFALLAAVMALAAGIGAILGSTGYAAIARALASETAPGEILREARALKADVAQLQKEIKSASDQIGALRGSLNQAHSATAAQFAKIADALERAEKRAASTPAATSPAPASEVTGLLPRPNAPPAKPIPGWIVRHVYDGVAVIEGRDRIIEAEPGAVIPNLGRVQEIKREKGRWLVVTSKGLISSR